MTIFELGEEYLSSAEAIQAKIKALKTSGKNTNGAERILLNRRIYTLCADVRQLKMNGKYLVNYYEKRGAIH